MASEYWARKKVLAERAKSHTEEMESKYKKDIDISTYYTKVYDDSDEFVSRDSNESQEIILSDDDTVAAAFKYGDGKTAVLNFASYKNPGGMFINGSSAQEEFLCHHSFLYNVLNRKTNYYFYNMAHKNRALYENRALYSPGVLFEKEYKFKSFDVITCAAPNRGAAIEYGKVSEKENSDALADRIKFVLDIADHNKVDTLILGAFGCGVFKQDAAEVAKLFLKGIKNYGFKKVVFAVPNKEAYNHQAFVRELEKEKK